MAKNLLGVSGVFVLIEGCELGGIRGRGQACQARGCVGLTRRLGQAFLSICLCRPYSMILEDIIVSLANQRGRDGNAS